MAPIRTSNGFDSTATDSSIDNFLVAFLFVAATILFFIICAGCCGKKDPRKHSSKQAKSIQIKDEKSKSLKKPSPQETATAKSPKESERDEKPPVQSPMIARRDSLSASSISKYEKVVSFAVALYGLCSKGKFSKKTVVMSPVVVQSSLMPLYGGSKMATRNQMLSSALFSGFNDKNIENSCGELLSIVTPAAVDENGSWNCAVRIYAPTEYASEYSVDYRRQFENLNERGGKIFLLTDIPQTDIDAAVAELNSWVGNISGSRLPIVDKKKKFFKKGTDRLILVSVCRFRCTLEQPFRAENTSSVGHRFLSYDGRRTMNNVPMMHGDIETYFFYEDNKCQVVRLPLRAKSSTPCDAAVYVFLPKQRGGLRAFESQQSAMELSKRMSHCTQGERIRVILPKLRIECRLTHVVDALKALGLQHIFDPKTADFTAMMALHSHRRPCVSDVLHAATFELGEDASETAPTGKSQPSIKSTKSPGSQLSEESSTASGKSKASGQSTANRKSKASGQSKSGNGNGIFSRKSIENERPCPVCANTATETEKCRIFLAEHPFQFVVAIEKPHLLPLMIGRFCG